MTEDAAHLREWRLLPVISAPMPFQMALDEILFRDAIDRQAPEPVLRFYYSSEPWVSVGYSHRGNGSLQEGATHRRSDFKSPVIPAQAGIHESRIADPCLSAKERVGLVPTGRTSPHSGERRDDSQRHYRNGRNIPVCRRLTGGGRVAHGNDIIFSLVLHKDADPSFKSVRVSYWKIHEAVKRAFERLGKSPRFYRCDEKLPKGDDCFVFPISSDLALGERKVAGGAQKRSQGFMLHQESVEVRKGMNPEDLIAALQGGFEEIYGVRLVPGPWHPEIFERAEELAEEKYGRV